jgi:hypothetical protein
MKQSARNRFALSAHAPLLGADLLPLLGADLLPLVGAGSPALLGGLLLLLRPARR